MKIVFLFSFNFSLIGSFFYLIRLRLCRYVYNTVTFIDLFRSFLLTKLMVKVSQYAPSVIQILYFGIEKRLILHNSRLCTTCKEISNDEG